MKKPTMNDIAKEAGVSQATVSYIINHSAIVSDETAVQVKRAMEKLGYVPKAQRQEKKKSPQIIALMIPDVSIGYYEDIIRGAIRLVSEVGYTFFLCNTCYSETLEKQYIDTLTSLNVAGIIVAYTMINGEAVDQLIRSKLPVVTLDHQISSTDIPSVEMNNYAGAESAVTHLYNVGARTICFVSEPLISKGLTERFESYKNTLAKLNLTFDEKLCFIENRQYDKFDMGYSLGANIVVNKEIDGVFVSSDSLAFGVIECLKKHEINIPDDMLIVGYDDDAFSSRLSPKLTSVAQPIDTLCYTGVKILLNKIKGAEHESYESVLEPHLVIRESTIKKS